MDSQLSLVPNVEELTGALPQYVVSSISASSSLIEERRAQTDALEYDLAVDVALAMAAYNVSARELARRTGLSRRRIGALLRMSARRH